MIESKHVLKTAPSSEKENNWKPTIGQRANYFHSPGGDRGEDERGAVKGGSALRGPRWAELIRRSPPAIGGLLG